MRVTEEQYAELMRGRPLKLKNGLIINPRKKKGVKQHEDHPAVQTADVERTFGDEPLEEKKGQGLNKKVNIHVHHRTKRLADPDGRSFKAVIDGLVEAGVLQDDSCLYVNKATQSQEKVKGEEETIITITEV